jgi:hypothetical protein
LSPGRGGGIIGVIVLRGAVMLWTVKETAECLGLDIHQVYYLLTMGRIEAFKIGDAWRVVPESARAYGKEKAA